MLMKPSKDRIYGCNRHSIAHLGRSLKYKILNLTLEISLPSSFLSPSFLPSLLSPPLSLEQDGPGNLFCSVPTFHAAG